LRKSLSPAEVICANRFNKPALSSALNRADVAFLSQDLDRRFLIAPNLRWVHCDHAGLDRSASPEVFERGLALTSSAGRSAPALAEHALFFMLALSSRFDRVFQAQRARQWGIVGQQERRALHGQTIGIVGPGHTGAALASYAKALGMQVIALCRKDRALPTAVDTLYCLERGDSLSPLLEQSDYLVLTVPLTDQTHHLMSTREFARMRPGAYFINIARGGLVDEQALVKALSSGQLAGAAIDVTEEEPLPSSSKLWTAPNLLITPHSTPRLEDREERSLEILLENIRRYRADEPLLNQLQPDDQFTPVNQQITRPDVSVTRFSRLARKLYHRWRTR
jgi:phosphoglycerate dehydrogenase-like enzyme